MKIGTITLIATLGMILTTIVVALISIVTHEVVMGFIPIAVLFWLPWWEHMINKTMQSAGD